jgi:hypothetical protein
MNGVFLGVTLTLVDARDFLGGGNGSEDVRTLMVCLVKIF